jgi:WD40 repeat protein/tetratricopeptide (TPR) repeat protein
MTDRPTPEPEEIRIHNQESLEELAWAIEASEGQFSLLLARCNYINLRERLIEQLQAMCAVQLHILRVQQSSQTLYTRIREEMERETFAALLIVGFEGVADVETMFASVNSVREEFRKNFPFPIVLWVTDGLHRQLLQRAPDLESWATTVSFSLPPNLLQTELQNASDRLFATLLQPNSPLSFRRLLRTLDLGFLQTSEIERAVADLHQAGHFPSAYLQATLDFVQGLSAATNEAALECFRRSLRFWEREEVGEVGEIGEVRENLTISESHPSVTTSTPTPTSTPHTPTSLPSALLLYFIGRTLYDICNANKHREVDWEPPVAPLQECLRLFEQANRPDLVAKCITQLERVMDRREAWDELAALVERSLPLQQACSNLSRSSQDYRYRAKVALHQGQVAQAYEDAVQALDLVRQVAEDRAWEGLYMLTLAQTLRAQGRHQEALDLLIEARSLGDRGIPRVYIGVLEELRSCYLHRKDYLEAFQIKQERLSVEQVYGIRAFVGAGRLRAERVDREQLLYQTRNLVREDNPDALVAPVDGVAAWQRQRDVKQLLERIGRNDCKLIVIHGYSGVGKSSLISAGLIPALEQKAIGFLTNRPILIRKYTDWQTELAHSLSPPSSPSPPPPPSPTPDTLLTQLRLNEQRNLRTILIFDQFEEFFFVHPTPLERRPFFTFLGLCMQIPTVKVVLPLREDYLYYLLEFNRIPEIALTGIDILSRNVLYPLGNFSPADARTIIEELTERARFYLEPDLVDELVQDLTDAEGQVRPVELQIVGAQLQTENIRDRAAYLRLRESGRPAKEVLVERYLADVVNDCGADHSELAERVLFLLTDEKGTRPLKTRAELEKELTALAVEPEPDRLDLVLKVLVGSGLVMFLPEVPDDRYQLVHDYLAEFIRQQQEPQLRLQIREAREKQREAERREQEALAELQRAKEQAKQDLAEAQQNKDQAEQELEAAKQNYADVNQKAKRRERLGIGILVTSLGVSLLAGLGAMRSIQSATEAQNVTRLERASLTNLQTLEFSPFEAVVGAMRSGLTLKSLVKDGRPFEQYPSYTPMVVLRTTLDQTYQRTQLEGHQGMVWSASYSPDGKTIVTASLDKTARVWDLRGNLITELKGHQDRVWSASYSPDGRTIVTASSDRTARVWDLKGNLITELKGHQDRVSNASYSPDGKAIVTASDDKTARVWDLKGNLITELKGHQDWVLSASYSPDGRTILTASKDKTARVWDLRGNLLTELKGHKDWVNGASYSPDGKYIVTASSDNTARVWDLKGNLIIELKGHQNWVLSASYSPDGKYIVTASRDKTARVWDLKGNLLTELKGHQDWLSSASYSPDGKSIVTASNDKTARVWDLKGNLLTELKGHKDWVNGASYSPDGKYIVTASSDKTARVWDLKGNLLTELKGHQDEVISATYSPDAKTIVTASSDKMARVWDFKGNLITELKGHQDGVISATYSPDGKTIVTASKDKTARVWDLRGNLLTVLKGHQNWVWSASYSPDGRRIVTASADKTARVWDLKGNLLTELKGHQSTVWSASFSPDGKYIVTASGDRTARIWTLQDFNQLLVRGCNWLQDYLSSTPDPVDDLRQFCGVKRTAPVALQNKQ